MIKPIDNDRNRLLRTNATRQIDDVVQKSTAQLQGSNNAVPAAPVAKLSQIARELSEAEPPIDHARIAQVRNAIARGELTVEPNVLADAILRHFVD